MKRPHLPPSSHQPERILVIKFRHHGDMLLTTPVIRSLTAAWPEAEIDVLLYEETRAMLACHPDIHRIYAIDRTWKKEGLRFQLGQEWRLLKILRQQRYDVVVNLADQWRSAIITRFTGAPVRLGFDFPKRQGGLWQRCHTHLVATDQHQTMHTVEQNLSLLHPLNLAAIDSTVGMHYSPDDAHAVQRLLNGTEKYIVIQPTSRWFFKCWSEEKFAAVLQSLRDDGHTIVLTSGPDTKELGMVKNIISLLSSDDKVISLAGQLTLNQLAALIDEAGLFIGVDSVPMHMAAALKTPCIALFGPSKLVFWRPWQVNGEVIWAGDFAPLPDPDSVDTKTSERYLDAIPVETVLKRGQEIISMKPIRLAIVRQKYRPDGGAERFIARALEALDQQALDLNVITRQWQGQRQDNWHLHLCNPMKWGRISRERGFASAARALWQREKFDIVQSHERIAGCDIYRAGDGVHQRWLEQRCRLLPAWRQKLLLANRYHRYVMEAERAMYQAPELKAVICNAHMVRQEIIERFGVASDKIHVIYNAINTAQFIPVDEQQRRQLRKQLSLPPDASLLIYVGSGFERKGLAAAMRALAGTNRYLVVVGKDKAERQYRALASRLGCANRVIFAGMQADTRPWYQAADGLLLPTLYDPFPNVILEAMACGLPVITSTSCGGSEFIRPGENGYICDALDIAALRDAIMALPEQASGSQMASHAREQVMGSSPQRLSQQLVSLYQQILE